MIGRLAVFLVWSLALGLAILPGSAGAAGTRIEVRVVAAEDGLRIIYDLPAETAALALRMGQGRQPAAVVTAEEPGLSIKRGTISAALPFRHVTLKVAPDSTEVNSVYPLLSRVGPASYVLHAPYLMPLSGDLRVRLETSNGGSSDVTRPALEGYVVIGAKPTLYRGFSFLSSTDAPEPLQQTIRSRAEAILAFYRRKLRRPPDQQPTIVLPRAAAGPAAQGRVFRGDVSNGIVLLRVYGAPAELGGPVLTAQYTSFLAHELFHLWNRSRDPDDRNWWLQEGGAEYASWLAVGALWPAEPGLELRLEGAVRNCSIYLGARALASLSSLESNSVRYPCGAVSQWLADVGARADSRGRDVFSIWTSLLARTGKGRAYLPADFRRAVVDLAPATGPAVDALLDSTGVERWRTMMASAASAGAAAEAGEAAPFTLRLAAAKALVLSACPEVYGVGEGAEGLFVQAPPGCRPFGDRATVGSVDGLDPMKDPLGLYSDVLARCRSRSEVSLVLVKKGEAQTERLVCTATPDVPPPAIKIGRALPVRDARR